MNGGSQGKLGQWLGRVGRAVFACTSPLPLRSDLVSAVRRKVWSGRLVRSGPVLSGPVWSCPVLSGPVRSCPVQDLLVSSGCVQQP